MIMMTLLLLTAAAVAAAGTCDWSEGVRAGYAAYLEHDWPGARTRFAAVISEASLSTRRCNVVAALNNLAVLDLLEDRTDAALVKLGEALVLTPLDDIVMRNIGWAQQQHPVSDMHSPGRSPGTDAYNQLLDLTVLRYLVATSIQQAPVDMHVFARHTRGVFQNFHVKLQSSDRVFIGQLDLPAVGVTLTVDAARVGIEGGSTTAGGLMRIWVAESAVKAEVYGSAGAVDAGATAVSPETIEVSPLADRLLADRSLELSIFERPAWHTSATTSLPLCGFSYRVQTPDDTRLFDVTGNVRSGVEGPAVGTLASLRSMHLDQIKRTLTGLFDQRYVMETSAATVTAEDAGGPLELLLKSGGNAQRHEFFLRRNEGYATMSLLNLARVQHAADPLVTVAGMTQASVAAMNHLETVVEAIIRDNIEGDVLEAGTWRGGLSIWMAAVLQAHTLYGDASTPKKKRVVWVADSFQGVPPPREILEEINDHTYTWEPNRYAVGMDSVRLNFLRYGFHNAHAAASKKGAGPEPRSLSPLLATTPVRFIQGYFNESLPRAVRDTDAAIIAGEARGEVVPPNEDLPGPRALAILRLDADTFEGTMDILNAMYHLLSPGGFVLVDDFHLVGARQAVRQFRKEHDIRSTMLPVPEDYVYGCRQGGALGYHTFPDKPVQGMYWRRSMT